MDCLLSQSFDEPSCAYFTCQPIYPRLSPYVSKRGSTTAPMGRRCYSRPYLAYSRVDFGRPGAQYGRSQPSVLQRIARQWLAEEEPATELLPALPRSWLLGDGCREPFNRREFITLLGDAAIMIEDARWTYDLRLCYPGWRTTIQPGVRAMLGARHCPLGPRSQPRRRGHALD